MTKIWLWNLLAFYVDDHFQISRKLVHRCFMLSLSFQGGLFNLLGFVLEQNSATNSLKGTKRKKEARWCTKVILACISNLCVTACVCVHLYVEQKNPIFSLLQRKESFIEEGSQKSLYIPWVQAGSTEILADPSPLKSWPFQCWRQKLL